jgi:hypothetical protein
MRIRMFVQFMLFGLIALILISVAVAFAAGMVIGPSNVDKVSIPVTAQDLKPPVCTMVLTNIIKGTGTITGTEGNDLIFGSGGMDMIDGRGGDDCILGDSSDDQITGGDGTDVCIGGSGNDTFDPPGTCETEIQ